MQQLHMSARVYHRILKLARTMARKAGLGPGGERPHPDSAPGGGDSVSAEKANLGLVVAFGLSHGPGWGATDISWKRNLASSPLHGLSFRGGPEPGRRVTFCILAGASRAPAPLAN
jgi:hypothetical protein